MERSGGARAWSTKSIAARLMALEAGSLYLSSRHRGKGRHHVCRSKPCSSQPDGAVASRGMVLEGFCRQNPAPARGKRQGETSKCQSPADGLGALVPRQRKSKGIFPSALMVAGSGHLSLMKCQEKVDCVCRRQKGLINSASCCLRLLP